MLKTNIFDSRAGGEPAPAFVTREAALGLDGNDPFCQGIRPS